MNTNTLNSKLALGAGAVIIIAAAFFGGYKYASAKSPSASTSRAQYAGGQAGMRADMGRFGGAGASVAFGQIVSKDDKSITVSIPGGGSKIVFLSASTTVSKMTTGSLGDLTVGQGVSVTGATNSDGSLTAATIDLRPAPQGK